jgi:hypothetical protein
MVTAFMEDVLGNTPYGWQKDVMSHIHMVMISRPHSCVDCTYILLVRPTDGGKSSVHDIFSLMNDGVALAISPLLSLGAGQEEKLKAKAKQTLGPVCPIHIDAFWSVVGGPLPFYQ